MQCYLCDTDKFEVVVKKQRHGIEKPVYRCLNCSLVFTYPRMSWDEEVKFYDDEYEQIYSEEKGSTIDNIFETRLPEAEAYYDLTKDILSADMDCLEVGCSAGYYLYHIKDKVKSILGVEQGSKFREIGKKHGVPMIANLDDCKPESFDRALLFFLFEHLTEPINFIQKVASTLRPGGVIFMEMPNMDDALFTLYEIPGFSDFYFQVAHHFYYTKDTLTRVLEKAGFNDIEVTHIQRYDLSNHIHWMMNGKPGGMGKYGNVFNDNLENAYSDVMIKENISDTLLVTVKI